MTSIKIQRLNHLVQHELSIILLKEVKNEEIKHLTITGVDISSDLGYAKIYYTLLNDDKKEVVEEALKKASPYIRTKLAEKIEVRHTPELVFKYDTSISYGEHIEKIINKLHEK